MLRLQYEGDVYRPPSEAKSLILQATIGCSYNCCTFCGMYKSKKYRERTLDEIEEDIALTSREFPYTRRVFLADGNALAMSADNLLHILDSLNKSFPMLERVATYGNPHDLLGKKVTQLSELAQKKLAMIYYGIESGSESVLNAVKKGATPAEISEGASRAKEANIPLSITVINGLAGVEGMQEHARETARLLNEIDPEYVGLLSLMPVPGTAMYRRIEEGKLSSLSPWQLLQEIKIIVENLSLTNCVFRANHASNYLPIKAVLSRDQDSLLEQLDGFLTKRNQSVLKSEFMRGL